MAVSAARTCPAAVTRDYRYTVDRGRSTMSSSALFRYYYYCCCCAALVAAVAAADGGAVKRNDPLCPADGCASVQCPRDQDACRLGLVPDGCGCCPDGVCGQGDAFECNSADRPCAHNLECVKTVNKTTRFTYNAFSSRQVLN